MTQRQDTGSELTCPLNYQSYKDPFANSGKLQPSVLSWIFRVSYFKPSEIQHKNESPYKIFQCHTSGKISLSVKGLIVLGFPTFNERENTHTWLRLAPTSLNYAVGMDLIILQAVVLNVRSA